ncbi:hypothetical protein SY83_17180 [Paenibacillus swuensis]|uniref:Uncharacterized protein n=1 Tax=Paenibacillus swuensis TaxID=1178515 RepID=A0A172TL11_9BACL|nr:endospore germination permease [Paenibacillus swuensis]ANE47728.1 hypothetical protein SY83_17180 [Paenibacillus swuensis]
MNKPIIKIGSFQLYCIFLQAQFGSSILSIANQLNDTSGTSAWMACLIGGGINMVFIYFIWLLVTKAPQSNVFQMIMQRFGNIGGRFLLFILSVLYGIFAYIILTNWIFTTNAWAYERTPAWMLGFIFIALCTYLTIKPISVYARFAVFATFFTPLFIIFAIYTMKDSNIYNVLPILDASPLNLLHGSFLVLWALAGIEIMLVLPRYVQHLGAKKVLRIAMLSNGTTAVLYTFCVFASMIVFGTEMITYIREPLLYQMKAISFDIIERIDLIIISVWILFVMSSFCSYFILFVSSIAAMFKKKEEAPMGIVVCCGGILFIASLYEVDVDMLSFIQQYIDQTLTAVSLVILIIILFMIKLIGMKGIRKS